MTFHITLYIVVNLISKTSHAKKVLLSEISWDLMTVEKSSSKKSKVQI